MAALDDMGLDLGGVVVFNRGPTAEERGESMVQKHMEKMQVDRENFAMEKLGALMPQLGGMVRAMALAETSWNVEQALEMLRRFYANHSDKLNALNKKRRKLVEKAAEQKEQDKQDAADDAAATASSSSSDSGSDDSGRGKKRSSRSHKRKRSDDDERKKHSKKKSHKEKDKGRKRSKPDEKPRSRMVLTHSQTYGKYGIIRETDFFSKRREFALWALDEKKIDVEVMPKFEERELFQQFIEDFNTGTMPHKKYYDLDIYERGKLVKEARRAAKNAGKKPAEAALPDPRKDEEVLRRQKAAERAKLAQERLDEAYREIKHTDKGRDMREQELLRMQMTMAYKTGDMATAHKLQERLAPDDDTKPPPRRVK